MKHRGKKYKKITENVTKSELSVIEAIKNVKKQAYTSFASSIDLHVSLNLPKDKDSKSIKASVSLPNPVSQEDSKIIVFCEKDDIKSAKDAGAIDAGLEDLVKKVQEGWTDFDIVLATSEVMPKIAILGKALGPKGLMPNPKTGTLVTDIKKGVEEFKKGKTKFSCDEGGVVHFKVGTTEMEDDKVKNNIDSAIKAIREAVGKNSPTLLKTIVIAPTMGPSVKIKNSEYQE
ncbi:50S ribosomal protein L1 [Candidatus Dojkabacteria bacterium]|nr:50S ribosomal protein L1 [Candidatus Dojkabacteria bacterium]